MPAELETLIARQSPDTDPANLVAGSWRDLNRLIDGHLEAGLSKFVVLPASGKVGDSFTDRFVTELHPPQD